MIRVAARTLVFVGILAAPQVVAAQATDVTTEVDVTVGRSTEDVRAAGTQLRLFGSLPRDWRFFGELAWADTWGEHSDAFGSA